MGMEWDEIEIRMKTGNDKRNSSNNNNNKRGGV